MTPPADAADSSDPTLATEPIENADSAEPTEPIDSTDPTEPIESTDPRLPMQRNESVDAMDQAVRGMVHRGIDVRRRASRIDPRSRPSPL
jgi:hypothetical protein